MKMKPSARDELLVRVDERTHSTERSINRLWKAIMGLYGIWGAIILTAVGTVVKAAFFRGN